MLVHPPVPAATASEFIAYAKADPGKINMGSGGKGATGHVAGELFQMMAGVKFQHIPYRGEAPAMTDLIGGQVQLVFATTGSSLAYVKTGKLRALAVTSSMRAKELPDVPPLADVLPGYEASSWSGFVVPKSTPVEIIDKLSRELNAAAADPVIQARFADLGGPAVTGSPADFGRIIADDVAKWAKVIKAAGLTGD
jgi:tripartite-type tricarboxylate transporter receptor subunit TctC